MSWTRYTIQKDDSDWKPMDGFKYFTKFFELDWKVKTNDSLIFDFEYSSKEGVLIDKDWQDWNKIGGISLASWCCLSNLWDKNNDAIMLAWRWNPIYKVIEFCVYENKDKKNIPYESAIQILRVEPGEEVSFKIRKISRSRYEVYLHKEEQTWKDVNPIVITPRKSFNMYSLIGMWYGGANNAPGPWGGKAPQYMYLDVYF